MTVKINNRRFRVPKGKREDSLIPSAQFVMRNRANGTAPKANKFNPHAEQLTSSVKVAISELKVEKEKKAKK